MEELSIESPTLEQLEEAEEQFVDELRSKEYLSRPDINLKMELMSLNGVPSESSFPLLEPRVEDLYLMTAFREGNLDDFQGSVRSTSEYSREWVKDQFEEGIYDASAYQEALIGLLDEDLEYSIDYRPSEINGLEHWHSAARVVSRRLQNHDEFEFRDVMLSTDAWGETAEQAYRQLENNLGFRVRFFYHGDEEATELYNNRVAYPNEEEPAVPGVAVFGKEPEPFVHVTGSESIGVDQENLEEELEM